MFYNACSLPSSTRCASLLPAPRYQHTHSGANPQAVLSQLRSVFDLVVEFQLRQEKLHTVLLDEHEYRRKNRAAQAARAARGQWAVDAPGEQAMAQHEATFYTTVEELHGDVTVIAKSLQVGEPMTADGSR